MLSRRRFPLQRKPLSKFTEEELMEILETNQTADCCYLACICSEVLRRMLKEKLNEKRMD